ncbi:hypothetical protein K469DRAFT_693382 [Zopfia rhizophila CBS 207.26]|uniref:Uncharacterized protein n=1 Tax=Zopfia rhizophila CBS 207.26 TaxID=1314779 RepID=A0A6A6DM94_9PEZI|nr:hypothetical protein K469DRAFT_693382 [Zopfia rhizophila CBS 207.26]
MLTLQSILPLLSFLLPTLAAAHKFDQSQASQFLRPPHIRANSSRNPTTHRTRPFLNLAFRDHPAYQLAKTALGKRDGPLFVAEDDSCIQIAGERLVYSLLAIRVNAEPNSFAPWERDTATKVPMHGGSLRQLKKRHSKPFYVTSRLRRRSEAAAAGNNGTVEKIKCGPVSMARDLVEGLSQAMEVFHKNITDFYNEAHEILGFDIGLNLDVEFGLSFKIPNFKDYVKDVFDIGKEITDSDENVFQKTLGNHIKDT